MRESLTHRKKLSEEIRTHLLEVIRNGSIPVGDTLPSERELMDQFGVGRPAIREAMQSLAAMGLITIRHGGRARVSEPSIGRMVDQVSETMKHFLAQSPASLENLKEARALFETELARVAARKRSRSDIDRLEAIFTDQAAAIANPPRFRALDGHFHREIAAISGNPIFPALIDALFGWLSDFHVDLVAVPGLEELTLQEHRGILDSLTRGDDVATGKAMADHLLRANELYRQSHFGRT